MTIETRKMRALALLLAAAAAACGPAEEEDAPPPNPVPTPTQPVIPLEGEPVAVARIAPENFEWPGTVEVTSPDPGVVTAVYSFDNPCGDAPLGALAAQRGDTVAFILRWPETEQDRACPTGIVPDAYRVRLDSVPAGMHTVAVFQAIEGQTAAALSHSLEVEVR